MQFTVYGYRLKSMRAAPFFKAGLTQRGEGIKTGGRRREAGGRRQETGDGKKKIRKTINGVNGVRLHFKAVVDPIYLFT